MDAKTVEKLRDSSRDLLRQLERTDATFERINKAAEESLKVLTCWNEAISIVCNNMDEDQACPLQE